MPPAANLPSYCGFPPLPHRTLRFIARSAHPVALGCRVRDRVKKRAASADRPSDRPPRPFRGPSQSRPGHRMTRPLRSNRGFAGRRLCPLVTPFRYHSRSCRDCGCHRHCRRPAVQARWFLACGFPKLCVAEPCVCILPTLPYAGRRPPARSLLTWITAGVFHGAGAQTRDKYYSFNKIRMPVPQYI
jgi:hypothetical protein